MVVSVRVFRDKVDIPSVDSVSNIPPTMWEECHLMNSGPISRDSWSFTEQEAVLPTGSVKLEHQC